MRLLVAPLALSAVLLLGSSCSPKPVEKCSASSCNGCCDAAGVCQTGVLPEACGTGGLACFACAPGQTCQFGVCITSTIGGGPGGGTGGGGGGAADGGAGGG
ncbi:MAG: hypothetical protein AB1938_31690, partial [Myxococcota bacterium]